MRVALLTMTDLAGTGPGRAGGAPATMVAGGAETAGAAPPLRAGLRLGGVSLARHQLGTMLALGCDRVICLAPALDAEMLALQQVAEHAGARFHVVAGARGLLGLVTVTDEVLALADGLSALPTLIQDMLDPGPAVVVQPIERGLDCGFERLDINHAAGGAWRIPGRLVERLSDLPPDCDAFSALQRIALQAGIGQRMLPGAALTGGRWVLVRSEAEAQVQEIDWIRQHIDLPGPGNPSIWLAKATVRGFGAALLHGGNGGRIMAGAGALALLLAGVAGKLGAFATAFCLTALAWPVLLVAALLGRIMRMTLRLPAPRLSRASLFGGAVDGLLIVLTGWALPALTAMPRHGLFAPAMLVGLCRLVGGAGGGRWQAWLQDRGVLALVLVGVTSLRDGAAVVEGMAVLVLLAGLLTAARKAPGAG